MPERARVVIDTNIFVSAFLFRGKPGLVLDLVEDGTVILIHSRDLRSEAGRILADKFHWSQDEMRLACDVYWNTGVPVTPQAVIQACRDPDDNRVLECAVEGHAQYIVIGDMDLLMMEKFRGCEILSPADFLLRKGV